MVISCASPCIQRLNDSDTAAAMAVTVNNKLASTIANNTQRFGGFAALSMHNATEAALELQRAVKELGFFGIFSVLLRGQESAVNFSLTGALLNDYQQSGSDGSKSPLNMYLLITYDGEIGV
jgi:2,3-dihydroxybenzoate decarboxylase